MIAMRLFAKGQRPEAPDPGCNSQKHSESGPRGEGIRDASNLSVPDLGQAHAKKRPNDPAGYD